MKEYIYMGLTGLVLVFLLYAVYVVHKVAGNYDILTSQVMANKESVENIVNFLNKNLVPVEEQNK